MKDRDARHERMMAMLDRVGLDEAILERRPSECSGGQLQRMVIARALLLNPKFLICDEPTSALDASIRAQILNLLVELKDQLDLTLVLISHDLRVVRYLCDRVAVMYLGQIVEVAPRDELFNDPRHPYTRVLLAASLTEQSTGDELIHRLKGEPPSPIDIPTGCRFHPRCPMAQDICTTTLPPVAGPHPEHTARCHFWDQLPATSASLPASTSTPGLTPPGKDPLMGAGHGHGHGHGSHGPSAADALSAGARYKRPLLYAFLLTLSFVAVAYFQTTRRS